MDEGYGGGIDGYTANMRITSKIGRPMLAATFVAAGADSLQHPEQKASAAMDVTSRIAGPLGLPDDPVTLVRWNAGVQVVAGSLLATGTLPRLAALALAGSLVPTTLAAHRFWEIQDDKQRAVQRIHFLKNLAMLGGLVLAAGARD
jgi:uncharacterized membrane protein YphA (DoxX/SURF4 family)